MRRAGDTGALPSTAVGLRGRLDRPHPQIPRSDPAPATTVYVQTARGHGENETHPRGRIRRPGDGDRHLIHFSHPAPPMAMAPDIAYAPPRAPGSRHAPSSPRRKAL